VPEHLLAVLQQEADRCYPLETGGLLVGYRVGKEWVVQDVVGPGPAARHRRKSFDPDHVWHAAELRARFQRSGGRQLFIGDWHTHPDGCLALSRRDLRALRRIIRSAGAQTPEPLSALLAGDPAEWNFAVWRAQLDTEGWLRRVTVEQAQLRQL
jgi:integrative and conjugative element protein (TIGR02256 family)